MEVQAKKDKEKFSKTYPEAAKKHKETSNKNHADSVKMQAKKDNETLNKIHPKAAKKHKETFHKNHPDWVKNVQFWKSYGQNGVFHLFGYQILFSSPIGHFLTKLNDFKRKSCLNKFNMKF